MGRVAVPGEPRWTPEDTALAVEWQRLQDETCRGCGQLMAESLDEASEYEVHKIVCFGCREREYAEEADAKSTAVDTAGRKITVAYAGRRPDVPDLTPAATGG